MLGGFLFGTEIGDGISQSVSIHTQLPLRLVTLKMDGWKECSLVIKGKHSDLEQKKAPHPIFVI